ncbi:HNH endonuclease [Undibacterium sp. CY7W]|uniref:HNH endonuclease n=1 Tax=Undibacterium rugosum TaxID=2762291 RepID=A0A923KWN5_9BURK|nr:HNH endonuclease [Undibacterium rugosum]MBC3936772.1 HNH endonuclease [Undibacterium rugosum]
MKYTVNITDIERALRDLGGEARAKAIQDKILKDHCRDEIPDNYQHEKSFRQTIQRKIEDYCPQAEGFDLSKKEPKFIRVGHGIYRHASGSSQREFMVAEEIENLKELSEGAKKTILVNAYERSAEARNKCLKFYGYECKCCGFNFERKYGELGKSYIHVHHIKPLSQVKDTYVVNPIEDLVPVCANCHAMIHRTSPALTIEELKTELRSYTEN